MTVTISKYRADTDFDRINDGADEPQLKTDFTLIPVTVKKTTTYIYGGLTKTLADTMIV